MESTTIPKNIRSFDDRDFEFLRNEGMKHIEAMSRKLWTDYNEHDPGITMLEALCYTITDLGYRIHQPVKDLLTPPENSPETLEDRFPTAKEILTTTPVSQSDYRKLFIDLEGINNAFVRANTQQIIYRYCSKRDEATKEFPRGKLSYKSDLGSDYKLQDQFPLNGLYNILFEPTPDIRLLEDDAERAVRIDELKGAIKDRYHANRNICEDLVEVKEVGYHDILVCGDIEIEPDAGAVEVMVSLLFNIQQYLSPSIKRYTLGELMDQGDSVEDIFEGPVLQNGFIRDNDLQKANIKNELHLSDLIQLVKETEGIKEIRKLRMHECPCDDIGSGSESEKDKEEQWTICFPPGHDEVLRLNIEKAIHFTNLFKDVIPLDADPDLVKQKYKERVLAYQQKLQVSYDDLKIEEGHYIDKDRYSTIQNDLPDLYGTGEYGLSPPLPPERHAKALQLKGYLLFFDQILATYFAHLKQVGSLLSPDVGDKTYFYNEVDRVKDFSRLKADESKYEDDVQKFIDQLDHPSQRKNEFLDHLLARFAENLTKHAFLLLNNFGDNFERAVLWHKSNFLKEYPEMSYQRPRSFNYYCEDCEVWDTYNVSGLEHRLARLLGIRDYSRRNLTSYTYEFYQEKDDDNISEWRWRIRNEEGNIMFSSSRHYHQKDVAEQEMWTTVSLAFDKNNYQLLPTKTGDKYYFNLIDQNKKIVARHIQYYNTRDEAEQVIEDFADYMFKNVADEGMFMFEQILFRPEPDDPDADEKFIDICMDPDCKQCSPHDPYSLRLTIVFPGWTRRFSNLHFREFAEELIRKEVPAHILTRICWIGNDVIEHSGDEKGQMSQLEDLYKKWLTNKMQHPENQKNNEFLKPLVDLLHHLETVYPEGKLFDCGQTGDSKSSIVLGKSTIGELKKQDNGTN